MTLSLLIFFAPLIFAAALAIVVAQYAPTVFYFAGQALHIWLKADVVAKSPKSGLNSVGAYLSHYKPVIIARLFAATCLFLLWEFGSGFLVDAGVPLRSETQSVMVACGIAGLIGLAADSLLDKVASKWSWLQGQIPPEPKPDAAAASAAAGGK